AIGRARSPRTRPSRARPSRARRSSTARGAPRRRRRSGAAAPPAPASRRRGSVPGARCAPCARSRPAHPPPGFLSRAASYRPRSRPPDPRDPTGRFLAAGGCVAYRPASRPSSPAPRHRFPPSVAHRHGTMPALPEAQAVHRERSPAAPERRTSVPARRRGLGRTLRRAVRRELAFPTAFALGGITFLVLAADMVVYSDLIVNRGFGAAEVGWVALYRSVPMLARAIPFAVLIGTLVALGRLGADREIIALEASGVSARSLARPVARFAAFFAAAGLFLALVAVPWAHRSLDETLRAFEEGKGGTPFRAGQVQRLGEWRIVARHVSPRGDVLRALAVRAPTLGGTVFAERAVLANEDGARVLDIANGVVMATVGGRPTQVRFDTMRQVL